MVAKKRNGTDVELAVGKLARYGRGWGTWKVGLPCVKYLLSEFTTRATWHEELLQGVKLVLRYHVRIGLVRATPLFVLLCSFDLNLFFHAILTIVPKYIKTLLVVLPLGESEATLVNWCLRVVISSTRFPRAGGQLSLRLLP